MTLPRSIQDLEKGKFVEDSSGDVAVRNVITDFTGDINVDNTALSLDGYVGKASGTNADFTTAYASATSLTCSSLPTGLSAINADDILAIVQVAAAGSVTNTYSRDDVTITTSGTDPTTVTVAGATFVNTDTFIVYTNIQRVLEVAGRAVLTSLVDTTNVAATTHYYPAATGAPLNNSKDVSLTGKFIDADGTLTLTLEVSNDEDTASADWSAVDFYDDKTSGVVSNISVTNGTQLISVSLNNINFEHRRWVVVASGATNTVILKEREKTL